VRFRVILVTVTTAVLAAVLPSTPALSAETPPPVAGETVVPQHGRPGSAGDTSTAPRPARWLR
jgi:hypothetical protein